MCGCEGNCTRMASRPEYGGIISASSMQVMPSDQMSTRVVYSCSQTSSGACTPIDQVYHGSDCQHGTPCRIGASASEARARHTIQYGVPVAVLCLSIVFTICVATPKSAAEKKSEASGGWAMVGGCRAVPSLAEPFEFSKMLSKR